MAKIDTYKCDGCGVLKGKSNHWWLVTVESGDLQIFAWTDDRARYVGSTWRHLCGRECVQKCVEKFMECDSAATPTDEQSKQGIIPGLRTTDTQDAQYGNQPET